MTRAAHESARSTSNGVGYRHEHVLTTPDGRYLVVKGRLWRRANPALAEEVRAAWVAL